MSWIIYLFVAIVSFVIMEGITWLTHKYVMHGFLWSLHESHHKQNDHFFEKNDTFFFIFAVPSWLCIMFGGMYHNWISISIGSGIALYGLAYFFVHDIIIHQRFKLFARSNNQYIKSLRWAHKMHHKHLDKFEGESFGLLFIAKKYREKIKHDEDIQKKKIMDQSLV